MLIDTLERYRADLSRQIETLQEQILSGKAASFDEYRFLIGQLRGFALAYNMTLPQVEQKEAA